MIDVGASPRLIDEWQAEPAIWNHVRRAVDDRPGLGHFILTGSAVPADDVTRHTGAGRMSRLRLRPMSLFELGHSTGHASLKRLMAGGLLRSTSSELALDALAELLCVGGWPGHLRRRSSDAAMLANEDYLAEICRVAVLEQLMVVEQQPAWAPHLRSRSRLRTSRKRHFVDPSLAMAGLGAGPEHLLRDVPWFGLLFESMVVRDLRVYAQAMRAKVYHYRDNTGLEVDAIVDAGPGRWGAFEIKLGVGRVADAARTLLTFAERVDTARCGAPAALAVVTSTGYGYRRPDGVAVIPVGVLGP